MERFLELRRHAATKKGEGRGSGSQLSREGVRAARAAGDEIDTVALVVASTISRTSETAIAMGYAVDRIDDFDLLHEATDIEFHEWLSWDLPFARLRALMDEDAKLAGYAAREAARLLELLDLVGDGETVLVVHHGGWLEATLVGCVPDADHASWGAAFGHLEGARLSWGGATFDLVAIRRC